MVFSAAFIAVLGVIFGSFLNVVIWRLPRRESLVRPGSHCPSCNKPIRFYENIPIVSFFLLKGRCSSCKTRISWRYPFVEFLTGLALVLIFLTYGFNSITLAYSVLALFIIPIGFIDWDTGFIPDVLTFPAFIIGVVLIFSLGISNWKEVLIGSLGAGGILYLLGFIGRILMKKESMGMGDVKLLVVLGVYLGLKGALLSVFFGSLVAMPIILFSIALKKLKLRDHIHFGPFIAIGTGVYMICGESIVKGYLNFIGR